MGISSTGIGSNLPVAEIIDKLVALEKKPLQSLQTSATFIQTQISTYGKVQSLLSGVTSAANAMAKASLWGQTSAGSSNPTALSATASAGASAGNYSVNVTQLASAHSLASGAYASGAAVLGSGKLKIELGKYTEQAAPANPSFTPKDGAKTINLEFSAEGTTLEDVRKAINDAKSGVTASIVKDASGARLTIRSDTTGELSALRISATDLADAPLATGLGALGYSPDSGNTTMQQTVAAKNALATVNGLDVVSESNTFSGAIENVSFTVSALTTTPATINVANDGAAQKKVVQDFVTAYNALNSFLVEQTKYDEKAKIGGALQGDSTVLNLRNQMRNILRETGAGQFNFLSMTSKDADAPTDGTITLDIGALDKAIADPGKLAKLFAGDASANITGMAKRLADFTTGLTGSKGSLSSRTEGLNQKLKLNEKDQDKAEDRIARLTDRLNKQYQALDNRMAGLSSLQNYINQQVANWNKSS
ncbi:flagellar filament capping protein FliD [Paucibacter sp. M5-1]|uniref:flagellar filament capping protein FliD n=1 Tax=Paucibacter sp. M5-1 TaxID=3015998 RepID=UPI0010FA45AD|nr:flagellar filament capping protein FliD [Paucibacter sp. M5-1]MCZ7884000.1 flagellar filament capping protein FliD [Paucibacter sp. M5-1]